jgi:hypothetical protein
MSDDSELVGARAGDGRDVGGPQSRGDVTPGSEQDSSTVVRTRPVVDPRGQRFNAGVSVAVLAVVLVAGVTSDLSAVLLAVQGVAFGMGAMFGLRFQPYGWFYRTVIRPRLGPPSDYEEEAPPRFAQLVGFLFVIVALFGVVFEALALAYVAVAFALAAAFLNAAFGLCLGCQFYLMFKRATSR